MKDKKITLTFKYHLPPKNYFILGLLYLKIPVLIPGVRWLIKRYCKSCDPSAYIIPGFLYFYGNIYVDKNVALTDTTILDYAPVYIGRNTRFSFQNMIITSEHARNDFDTVIARSVHIGKNVWVTSRCIILGGVTIGDNSVIGAGSVVTKDIPANCFAAGNPAKVIKYFSDIN